MRRELGVVEGELNRFTETTNEISTSLANAQDAIDQYQKATTQLKAQVENAIEAAPGWILAITWILSVFLIWLLIAQIGLGAQGFDMLRGHRKTV